MTASAKPASSRALPHRGSWLSDLRVPVKIAQELGHAIIATTLNIYTHVIEASHRQAIEAVERQLFPTVPKSGEQGPSSGPVSS